MFAVVEPAVEECEEPDKEESDEEGSGEEEPDEKEPAIEAWAIYMNSFRQDYFNHLQSYNHLVIDGKRLTEFYKEHWISPNLGKEMIF